MCNRWGRFGLPVLSLVSVALASLAGSAGCISSSAATLLGSSLFTSFTGSSDTSTGGTGGDSGFFSSGGRVNLDPCSESNSRKFIRISMRNLAPNDYVHYFLVLIAYVNGETYPTGAVCVDDVDLYTSFGYTEISDGSEVAFGNYCIQGPALIYFHENGQFRRGGGTGAAQLASAIAPAQGTNATYDNFFASGGVAVPVPNQIIFHNPGTGEGAALIISFGDPSPCEQTANLIVSPDCDQDAFYYVDESDLIAGSIFLGTDSGRRVPSEIQGTGCECSGFQDPFQSLAPSGTAASNARCNEFLRGGMIEYAFVREDTNPPFPQLVWRVTDQSGAVVHEFDARANIP